MLRDTARWGAFLGTFAGGFVFWDELIHCLGGSNTRAWRAMAAGVLAGPALLLVGRQAHTSLALYVFIRGVTLLIRCGNIPEAHPAMRKLLAATRWRHGDVALMCASVVQLCYSWIALPQTLPAAYTRFLNKHGGKPPYIYQAIREMSSRAAAGIPPGKPLAALANTRRKHFAGPIACGFVHPGQTCTQHAVAFFPESYKRSLPVYLPVYVIPALLVHRRKLLSPSEAPLLWRKVGLGVLRSALFLSLFCTLAWRGSCVGFNLTGRTTGAVMAVSCWVGGLALLAEKPSRRMELALYCFSRAVESFALTAVELGWVRAGALPRRTDVLLFSLGAGAVLHCYSDHLGERRGMFRSAYINLFDWLLGNAGFDSAAITHKPSNADILLRSVRSVGTLLARKCSVGAGAGGRGGAACADAPSGIQDASPGQAGQKEEDTSTIGSNSSSSLGAGGSATQDEACLP